MNEKEKLISQIDYYENSIKQINNSNLPYELKLTLYDIFKAEELKKKDEYTNLTGMTIVGYNDKPVQAFICPECKQTYFKGNYNALKKDPEEFRIAVCHSCKNKVNWMSWSLILADEQLNQKLKDFYLDTNGYYHEESKQND